MAWPKREKLAALKEVAKVTGLSLGEVKAIDARVYEKTVVAYALVQHPNGTWSSAEIKLSCDMRRVYNVQVTSDTDKFIALEELKLGIMKTYCD